MARENFAEAWVELERGSVGFCLKQSEGEYARLALGSRRDRQWYRGAGQRIIQSMSVMGQEPLYVQIAQVIFYLTPVVVFLLTAGAAAWRFNIFRTGKPSLKIDLEVTSGASSDSYNELCAVALVTNTSRVVARCDSLRWEIRVLAPFDDEDIESKISEFEAHMATLGPAVDFPWNVQYRIQNDDPGIALEPGESNVVDMSLAIPQWITAVDVRCTLVLTKGKGGPDYVWTNRSPHDILTRG